ncbi:ABC transporter permease [Marinococcus sp. PL1-022]|uniref:ABC transporter permease n=1 Tax=Marinococcus sp. PL1-022 TaxID=3095363 RepID=UPI0029C34834|nr:ABC transporter permease subunit [Marinococcus sp. PL1-022]MDX6152650.1 ABC transporter permease subunit [Marinococcus sp. PL1-022]
MFAAFYRNDMKQFTRNQWLVWFGLLFVLVSTSFILFGGANTETYDGFNTTTASLLNVNLFLLPLILFVMGAVSVAAEKEEGLFALVVSYPISYMQLVTAKILSLVTAMLLILCFSYGVASMAGFFTGTSLASNTLILFLFLSVLLIVLLAPLAIFMGVCTSTKFQAMALALGVWAFLVLLYEFLFMGLITMVPPLSLTVFLTLAVAANPVELVRVATIIIMDGGVSLGPSLYDFTAYLSGGFGALILAVFAVLWLIVPTAVSYGLIRGGKTHGS